MQTNDVAAQVRRLGRMLRDQWWVIALCTIIAVQAAVVYTSRKDTLYTAATKLLLLQEDPNSTVTGGPLSYVDPVRQRATDLDLVKSPRLAARVVRDLKLKGRDAFAAFTGVNATAQGDSNVVTILVTNKNRRLATRLADAYAREYVQFRRDLSRARYDQALADVNKQLRAQQRNPGSTPEQVLALKRQKQALQLLSGVRLSDATVVQETNGRADAVKPTWRRNIILAALFGLVLGVALAFLRDRLDDRIRTEDDLAELLPNVPIIATIPNRRRGKGWRRSAAESYHNLRVNVMSADGAGPLSVLVTSGMGREGKTSIAVNLALALTEEGRAALIVDADLRRPRVTEMLGSGRGTGFVNVMGGHAALDEVTQVHKFEADNGGLRLGGAPAVTVRGDVAVLPAGRTTVAPQKLITDESVQRLLDQAAAAGRPTVVDGPPIGLFGDMVPVARRVDAVVVVVRLYFTRRRSLQALARQLESVGVHAFGIVVIGGKPGEQRYYGA